MWCFEQGFPPTAKATAIGYGNYDLLIKVSRLRVVRRSSHHQNQSANGNGLDDPYNDDLMRRSSNVNLNRVAPILKSSKYLVV
jgi:retron-type reverse transcriptase